MLAVATAGVAGCIGNDERLGLEDNASNVTDNASGDDRVEPPANASEPPSTNATADEPEANRSALPDGFDYECPAGETTTRSDGLCFGTIASRTNAHMEPYVAVHPERPEVVAVGVNTWQTADAPTTHEDEPGVEFLRLDVFVTDDGGATWERVRHPFVERPGVHAGSSESGDPALAFDDDGVLHLSGLVLEPALSGLRVFYTSTPDLGETWTDPVLLIESTSNDRNWITVGPDGDIYVPWQRAGVGGPAIDVAWSFDDGDSWSRTSRGGCNTASPVVLTPQPIVSCAVQGDDGTEGIEVLGLNASAGELDPLAEIDQPGATWPQLEATPDGTVHLVTESSNFQHIWYATSENGGHNWSEPVDLREEISVEDDWDNARAYWVTSDAWGTLHLIVSSESEAANTYVGPKARPVAHVALDPSTLDVIESRTISTDDPREQMRIPPPPPLGVTTDHYYGLDFAGDTGFMAWTRDNGIDYTLVEPVGVGNRTANG